ncbi:MAG: 6-phosphogluconolactonase [Limisphaerales bacterium]|jgi:6-phosphogluconolactonase
MKPTLHNLPNPEVLCQKMAEHALHILQPTETLASIALTGGRTAEGIYTSICEQSLDIPVRWRNVHFFWGDERCVPMNDPESNYKLAHESLLKPLRIHPANIHRIPTQLPPEEAAIKATEDYEDFLKMANASSLRMALLSMGEDGHIASLFPDGITNSLNSYLAYSFVTGPKPPPERITLNFSELAIADHALIAISGEEKKKKLEAILSSTIQRTPLGELLHLRSRSQKQTHLYITP